MITIDEVINWVAAKSHTRKGRLALTALGLLGISLIIAVPILRNATSPPASAPAAPVVAPDVTVRPLPPVLFPTTTIPPIVPTPRIGPPLTDPTTVPVKPRTAATFPSTPQTQAPPPTFPPVTAPPVTAPPATSPPVTAPPDTGGIVVPVG